MACEPQVQPILFIKFFDTTMKGPGAMNENSVIRIPLQAENQLKKRVRFSMLLTVYSDKLLAFGFCTFPHSQRYENRLALVVWNVNFPPPDICQFVGPETQLRLYNNGRPKVRTPSGRSSSPEEESDTRR